jgi:hypothetical protein
MPNTIEIEILQEDIDKARQEIMDGKIVAYVCVMAQAATRVLCQDGKFMVIAGIGTLALHEGSYSTDAVRRFVYEPDAYDLVARFDSENNVLPQVVHITEP